MIEEETSGSEILAIEGLTDERTFVLACGDTFAVFDRRGDVMAQPTSRHGMFFDGTRFVNRLGVRIANRRPLLLSSGIRGENQGIFAHLTNPDLRQRGGARLPRETVHIVRTIELFDARCRVAVRLHSYADDYLVLPLDVVFGADFADVFEVRGAVRAQRGTLLATELEGNSVVLGYVGIDGVQRHTSLRFSRTPSSLEDGRASFSIELAPGAHDELEIGIECELRKQGVPRQSAFAQGSRLFRADNVPQLHVTSLGAMGAWLRRSAADLAMATAETPHGPFPYAGVPWFHTPFGRDALLTAYEVLWIDPALARGVLRFLAAHQAEQNDLAADAEPGKIIHEMRAGEMAALQEIPFGCYYGSVDATPLFALLAAAYHERTADDALLRALWPRLESALAWIEGRGDIDGDGFVEYVRRSPSGLLNQGWKDSRDSIMHADGSLADGPIALCEVQAYVYAARKGLARVARALGNTERADQLERSARDLREAFVRAFWCEDLGTYALALDGKKQPCRVRSSNAGHALFCGIAPPEHADILARTLLSDDHFSGWGVRTLATSMARYNPMSYHNGSVWPHDNALLAVGLARYGHVDGACAILTSLCDASRAMDDARLPELLCGFPRRPGEVPTLYPVACSPQAWSSGAVFLLLQAVLGLSVDAARRQIRFSRATLPPAVEELRIGGLSVRGASVDLLCERNGDGVDLRVLRRTGDLDVVLSS
jgi:glycogen debranching enzyme